VRKAIAGGEFHDMTTRIRRLRARVAVGFRQLAATATSEVSACFRQRRAGTARANEPAAAANRSPHLETDHD
jgi:hypothetical protein